MNALTRSVYFSIGKIEFGYFLCFSQRGSKALTTIMVILKNGKSLFE